MAPATPFLANFASTSEFLPISCGCLGDALERFVLNSTSDRIVNTAHDIIWQSHFLHLEPYVFYVIHNSKILDSFFSVLDGSCY